LAGVGDVLPCVQRVSSLHQGSSSQQLAAFQEFTEPALSAERSIKKQVWALVAHETSGYEEWGASSDIQVTARRGAKKRALCYCANALLFT